MILLLCCGLHGQAFAEGTDQLNVYQALRGGTQLYVDILDTSQESILWTGRGSVQVTAPDGTALATLSSGQSVSLSGRPNGAFGVLVQSYQWVGFRWDVEVVGQTTSGGRLFSYDWAFNAGSYAPGRATNGSFYALVPGGQPNQSSVVELALQGLSGFVYNINANRVGVLNNGGRSVQQYGHQVQPEFPIYLRPPTVATYARISPAAYGFQYIGGVSQTVGGAPMTPCNKIVPGQSFGFFQFDTNARGSFHVQCDLDQDGIYESTNNDDLLFVGTTDVGFNRVTWDGLHQGTAVPVGTYNCRLQINVGEFHYVGTDIETSYPGMAMYEVDGQGNRRALTMFWNDSVVQYKALSMPNGLPGLSTSGPTGVVSAPYGTTVTPNVNARSWGNWVYNGKGNQSLLDTYVYLDSAASTNLVIEAVDSTADSDGDGLSNFEESCYYGSDPSLADTDGNGVDDRTQYAGSASSSGVGGLESNGRMATQLARRALERGRWTPKRQALRSSSSLTEMVRNVELVGATRVDATPEDLPALTNAVDVVGVDFLDEEYNRGSILLIETEGAVYEHSKAVCDRAHGGEIVDLRRVPYHGTHLVGMSIRRLGTAATLDHALVFKLYEEDGKLKLYSGWVMDDLPTPRPGQRVVNVQVWARGIDDSQRLATALLDELVATNVLSLSIPIALDESNVEQWSAPPPATSDLPSAFFAYGSRLGRQLRLVVRRTSGVASEGLSLRFTGLPAQGTSTTESTMVLRDVRGEVELDLTRDLERDVTVDLIAQGKVVDRLWLSDGWWAPFDDSLWGGGTTLHRFDTQSCPLIEVPTAIATHALVELAGCASVEAKVSDYAGVARHVVTGFEHSEAKSFSLHLDSSAPVDICLENTELGTRACVTSIEAPVDGWVHLPRAAFHDVDRADLVTVFTKTRGLQALSVGTLVLRSDAAPPLPDHADPGTGTCQTTGPVEPLPLASLIILRHLLLLRARRRLRRRYR